MKASQSNEELKAKLAYWREHGAFALHVPEGWGEYPSLREREREAIADAESTGRPFERYTG